MKTHMEITNVILTSISIPLITQFPCFHYGHGYLCKRGISQLPCNWLWLYDQVLAKGREVKIGALGRTMPPQLVCLSSLLLTKLKNCPDMEDTC